MKQLFTLLSILCIYLVNAQTPIHIFNFDGSLTNTDNTVTLTRSGTATTTYAADRFGFANKACVNPLGQALQGTISNLPLGNSARSVSIWVNFSGGFSNTHFIWSYGTNLTSQAFGLTQEPASVINYGWANDHVATLGYVQGNWYNYVITYDGAISKIYRNGTLISQSTKAWNTVGNIFRIATNPATTLYLNATIDELRIYNVALTATQVANIYAGADLPTITNIMSSAGSTPTNYYINYKLLANDANATAVVKYGTSINNLNLTSTSSTATGTTALNANVLLSGLSTTTKYYYQIEATNSVGTKSSLIDSFNTSNVAALPTLNPATATVDATTAIINYTAQANFANTITRVVYGTSKTNLNLNTADSSVFANASNPVTSCKGFISGLAINTKYYYQIEAVNIMGTTRSVIDSFTVNEFLRQGLVAYYGLENSLFSFDGIHNLTEGTTATRTFAAGKYGLGSNFSNNPLINTSISSLLNNDTTQKEYTICFWENRNSIITFQSSYELFGSQYFRSQNNSNVGFMQGLANASASNFVEITTNSFAFNLMNAWQHYAVQVKKVGNTKFLRTYINGVLEAELNLGNAAFVYKFHDKIAIGGGTDAAGAIQPVKFFSGSLDEIYFYNRALSPAEITSVQNNTAGIIFNGIVAKPTLRFDSVTNLTNAGATINFGVKTNNGITNTSIKYSTNKTALTNVLSGATLANNVGNTFQPTTITVSGLLNNTKYYYQLKALNSAGADSTVIDSFVTKDAIQPGLIAYYGFENNFNSHNAQNNLTSATTNATVPNFVTGKFGQSVNLSGSNALVNNTILSLLNFAPSVGNGSDYTVCFWERRSNLNSFSTGYQFGGSQYFRVQNNLYEYGVNTNGGLYWATAYANTLYTDITNTWNHIAIVNKLVGTVKYLEFYRNGVLDKSIVISPSNPFYKFNNVFSVGAQTLASGGIQSGTYFTGAIDEMYIYNRALSLSEVAAIRDNASGVALPSNLSAFSAKLNSQTTQLNWSTSQEINTSHFNIEYSNNGKDFTTVQSISAAGNSSSIKNYTASHIVNNEANHYYRLKMLDKDGSYTYSHIVKLKTSSKGPQIEVYPTVATNKTTVSITAIEKGNATIAISNMQGQVLQRLAFNTIIGSQTQSIDLSNLSRGNYIVTVFTNNQQQSFQIMKQ